ncbi:MAG: hypothetical protein HDQ97_16220 [Lachnospiraceae bacterium]|nr:hypothetical protein [Lachnospiraceae bacterium]
MSLQIKSNVDLARDSQTFLKIEELLAYGEPTCYEGLGALIHHVSSSGLNAVLITNGIALSDRDS